MKNVKEFNLVVAGVGGQGLLILAGAVARAALKHGYQIRASELHGLAMRFGAIEANVRFGHNIYSPIIRQASADLIIALEPGEAIRAAYYAGPKTTFLIDTKPQIPTAMYQAHEPYPSIEQIVKALKKYSKRIITSNASNIVYGLTGSTIAANIYLLGRAGSAGLIPLKKSWLLDGIKEVVPPATWELNEKLFKLGWSGKR